MHKVSNRCHECRLTTYGSKKHNQQDAKGGDGQCCDVAAIVAVGVKLVKVSRVVGGPSAQLASRSVVAGRAVAVALVASMDTSATRRPIAARLAVVGARGRWRMPPVLPREVERRGRGVQAAADTDDCGAVRAQSSRRIGKWAKVALGANATLRCTNG
eukprot:6149897-Prymnesium_polylepis.3